MDKIYLNFEVELVQLVEDDARDEEVDYERLLPCPAVDDATEGVVQEEEKREDEDHVLTGAIRKRWTEKLQTGDDEDDGTPPVRQLLDQVDVDGERGEKDHWIDDVLLEKLHPQVDLFEPEWIAMYGL